MRTGSIPQKQFIGALNEVGLMPLEEIPSMVKSADKFRVKCLICGNTKDRLNLSEFTPLVHNVIKGKGCPKCAGNQTPTWSEVISFFESLNIKILSKKPDEFRATSKLRAECKVCGYNRNQSNTDAWLVTYTEYKNNPKRGCLRCNRRNTANNNEIQKVFKQKGIQIISDLKEDKITNRYKFAVRCPKCGNTRNNLNTGPWRISYSELIDPKRPDRGCPKCKNTQRKSPEDVNKLIEGRYLLYLENKPKSSFSKIRCKCLKCDTVFETHLVTLLRGDRPCDCNKMAWYHYQEIVKRAFGCERYEVPNSKFSGDCYIKEKNTIVELKFRKGALRHHNAKVDRQDQIDALLSTGKKVVFLVCEYRSRISDSYKLDPRVEYFFIEDFQKFKIGNKKLTKNLIKKILHIYNFPYLYNRKPKPLEHQRIRSIFVKECRDRGRLLTPEEIKIYVGCSWSTIYRAFGVEIGDRENLAKKVAVQNSNKIANASKSSIIIDKNNRVTFGGSMQQISFFFQKSHGWCWDQFKKSKNKPFKYEEYIVSYYYSNTKLS